MGLHFNWIADPEPDWVDAFAKAGGNDPAINPRPASSVNVHPFRLLTDANIVDHTQRRRHAFYADILAPIEMTHFCGTIVLREPCLNVGLAVLRHQREGEITEEQQRNFEITEEQQRNFGALALHVRAAVRGRPLLQQQEAAVIADTLEAVELTAFVCDRLGRVRALTPAAEALVRSSTSVRIHRGRLGATTSSDTKELDAAIAEAAGRLTRNSLGKTVVVPRAAEPPLVIEVIAIPLGRTTFAELPSALVLMRGDQRGSSDVTSVLQAAFGLTPTEAAVAFALTQGNSLEEIAEQRQRSTETIRTQVRSSFAKLGVSRQGELVALLSRFRQASLLSRATPPPASRSRRRSSVCRRTACSRVRIADAGPPSPLQGCGRAPRARRR
jgi:DNA-binding CsgD family transcriptional regulator